MVYIREAHASDGARPGKDEISKKVKEAKTYDARLETAGECMKDLDLKIPCLIDDMDDSAEKAYSGWPDRLFVVDTAGKIAYRGDQGPSGFKPELMEEELKKLLK